MRPARKASTICLPVLLDPEREPSDPGPALGGSADAVGEGGARCRGVGIGNDDGDNDNDGDGDGDGDGEIASGFGGAGAAEGFLAASRLTVVRLTLTPTSIRARRMAEKV